METVPQSYILVLAIFTAITAVAVLIQAGVLLGMFIVMRKSMMKMQALADEVKGKALPALTTTQALLEDLAPKLKVATANLTEVTHTLRTETKHVTETVDVLLNKANVQMNRVDGMLTATFDAVDHAAHAMENAVTVPVRRFSGVVNGVRTGVEFLFRSNRRSAYNGADGSAAEWKPEVVSTPERKPEVVTSEPAKVAGFVAGQKQA